MATKYKNPTVDVIIPAFNAARFIKETIKSVLNQTYMPRKIIIVDDGSTDNTIDIINDFESNLIELISVENGGVSRARNIGIKKAKADYIAFLDADDIWSPAKLEAQITQLKENLFAGVCYSGTLLIDQKGKEIENTYGKPYVKGYIFENILYYEEPIYGSASSIIVSRDILMQTKLFDENMQYSEDVDLWARLALLTEFDYVKEPYVKIRVHPYSSTRNQNWDISRKILLHHFYYINKYAKGHQLPESNLQTHKRRIIRLFFNNYGKLIELPSFYYSLRASAPYLCKQMRSSNIYCFMSTISLVFFREILIRLWKRLLPFQRAKLFFTEGTLFFSHSKNYNPDVEFIKKKRT